jgi:hypothetical protein
MHQFVPEINLRTGAAQRVLPKSDGAGPPAPGVNGAKAVLSAAVINSNRVGLRRQNVAACAELIQGKLSGSLKLSIVC